MENGGQSVRYMNSVRFHVPLTYFTFTCCISKSILHSSGQMAYMGSEDQYHSRSMFTLTACTDFFYTVCCTYQVSKWNNCDCDFFYLWNRMKSVKKDSKAKVVLWKEGAWQFFFFIQDSQTYQNLWIKIASLPRPLFSISGTNFVHRNHCDL